MGNSTNAAILRRAAIFTDPLTRVPMGAQNTRLRAHFSWFIIVQRNLEEFMCTLYTLYVSEMQEISVTEQAHYLNK